MLLASQLMVDFEVYQHDNDYFSSSSTTYSLLSVLELMMVVNFRTQEGSLTQEISSFKSTSPITRKRRHRPRTTRQKSQRPTSCDLQGSSSPTRGPNTTKCPTSTLRTSGPNRRARRPRKWRNQPWRRSTAPRPRPARSTQCWRWPSRPGSRRESVCWPSSRKFARHRSALPPVRPEKKKKNKKKTKSFILKLYSLKYPWSEFSILEFFDYHNPLKF